MNEHTKEDEEVRRKNPQDLTFLDADALSRFVTDTGKILPRKYTGLTPSQQRRISRVIKTARHMQVVK
ncbi:MAG: 30S ribosomal protein S18 [Opitutales bacterium]